MPSLPGSLDPASDEIMRCPYDFYRMLRSKGAVCEVPAGGCYMVSAFETIREVLHRPDLFLNDIRGDIVKTEELKAVYLPTPTLSQCDPPKHALHRRIVERALSPGRVNAMEPQIRALVDELIDAFIDRGQVELYREFASPLPMTLLSDVLVGHRSELDRFKAWSTALVLPTQGVLSIEQEGQVAAVAREFNDYFLLLLRERREKPADDLISALATAMVDEPDDRRPLSDDEFISMIQQLLTGGKETSSSAICSAVLAIIEKPALLAAIRVDGALLDTFIEEILRLESPIQGLWRRVKSDTTLAGVPLPAGTLINLRFGAANRDERRFADAETMDLRRRNAGQHLGFGSGIHSCIGRALIKKELSCALASLIARLDDWRLVPGTVLEYRRAFLERSLKALPMTFVKRKGPRHV
jgi:cytochrome P450